MVFAIFIKAGYLQFTINKYILIVLHGVLINTITLCVTLGHLIKTPVNSVNNGAHVLQHTYSIS